MGVCGSSAATATDQLVTVALNYAERVTVIATPTAARLFLPALDVPVITDADWREEPLHITLPAAADTILVAPATASTIAKAAAGIADTLLTATILTRAEGIYFYPCMNARMWANPILARNVNVLHRSGHHVLDPAPVATLTSNIIGAGVGTIPGDLIPTIARHHAHVAPPVTE